MKTRIISAAVMLAIVAVCLVISPYTRLLLILAAAVLSCREMGNALRKKDFIPFMPAAYVCAAAPVVFAALGMTYDIGSVYYEALAALCMAAAIFAGIVSLKIGAQGAMATLMMMMYPLMPLALIARIIVSDSWLTVCLTAALATWICDSFCLFGGKLFGKHKLAPHVSPNKTWEGTLCGAAFSVLSGVIVYFILGRDCGIPLWLFAVTSLAASSMGQIGDLAASLFKRMAGIKDYSNLIPGHGGMLDRADSLLFAIPTAYFFFLLAGVI